MGMGYIGLPMAAMMANAGHHARGVDINENAVSTVNKGAVHFVEPELDTAVQQAVSSGRLKAFLTPSEADIFIICVPTPLKKHGTTDVPDIQYVLDAVEAITPFIKPGNYIVVESTIPVGTTQKAADTLVENGVDISTVHIAHCPERVIPGRAMVEMAANDRIVGGLTQQSAEKIADVYRSLINGKVFTASATTAEMVKLAENSFRDVNIAFANELSLIASHAGVDVWELIALANHHPRVNILRPSVGVGGHCIAVDPWFLVASDPENAHLISTARKVNDYKTEWVIQQIRAVADAASRASGKPPRIALCGLSFKPDTDDLRESPAVKVAESLHTQGYTICCVEPHISSHGTLPLMDLGEALETADIVVMLVNHSAFDFDKISKHVPPQRFLNFVGGS